MGPGKLRLTLLRRVPHFPKWERVARCAASLNSLPHTLYDVPPDKVFNQAFARPILFHLADSCTSHVYRVVLLRLLPNFASAISLFASPAGPRPPLLPLLVPPLVFAPTLSPALPRPVSVP